MGAGILLLTGALAGGGLLLIVVGAVSTATPLQALVDSLHRPRTRAAAKPVNSPISSLLAGRQSAQRDADLAVCDRTVAKYVQDRVLFAAIFGGVPLTLGFLLRSTAAVSISPVLVLLITMLGAVGGFMFAVQDLRSDAEKRRRQFRHAMAAYLELVTILIAGGRGVESALYDAVELGHGDDFRQLRLALAGAQARRVAPWRALGDLGRRLNVSALEELESSMVLAGESGARVRESLLSKAKALRIKDMNEIEAEAQARSETMVFPVVLMFAAFIVFVGYPALAGLSAT